MIPDKYIGLILAMSSSVFIGLSFIITKKGLINAQRRHGKDILFYFGFPVNKVCYYDNTQNKAKTFVKKPVLMS